MLINRFLFLIVCISAFDHLQVETNIDDPILLTQKTFEKEIRFTQEFSETPIIHLSTIKLSIDEGTLYSYELAVKSANPQGFTLFYSKYCRNSVTIQVEWMAIVDPRLQVQEFISYKDPKHLIIPISSQFYSYSLIGFTLGHPSLLIKDEKIIDSHLELNVEGRDIEMIKLSVISGIGLSSQMIPITVNVDHPWMKRDKGNSFMNIKYNLNNQKSNVLSGIVGFNFKSNGLKIQMKETKNKGNTQVGTLSKSKLKEAQIVVLAYDLDETILIGDKNCVELFQECYFKGDSYKLCENGDNLQSKENITFKSFMVPNKKIFQLVNKSGIQELKGTESCTDQIELIG